MSARTPMPWSASPHGDGWHIVAHSPQKDGSMLYSRIATVHAMKGDDAKLIAAAPELLEAATAAMAYDAAIRSAANDPDKMSSYCTAAGEDLDGLYARWMTLSSDAILKATGAQL